MYNQVENSVPDSYFGPVVSKSMTAYFLIIRTLLSKEFLLNWFTNLFLLLQTVEKF